jgi:glycosyltransferase involved in cell wall biosynthesis
MNVGVYITVLDDEYNISACVRNVKKVFPRVEVIDLGSRDSTINKVKDLGVPVHEFKKVDGAMFTRIKNEFSEKHDWVVWIDSDEIYLPGCLEDMKAKIRNTKHESIRVSWRLIKEEAGQIYMSNSLLINGCKAYNTNKFRFKRAWPREVLEDLDENVSKEPKHHFNGIWCYHMVLLPRSSQPENRARERKRKERARIYDELEWLKISEIPFER